MLKDGQEALVVVLDEGVVLDAAVGVGKHGDEQVDEHDRREEGVGEDAGDNLQRLLLEKIPGATRVLSAGRQPVSGCMCRVAQS